MNKEFFLKFKYPLIVALFIIAFVLLIKEKGATTDNLLPYVKVAGQDIQVDLAITKEEQMQGLSGRDMLEPTKGMLFIFEKPGKYSFWMQGMNFPIDIIWIDEAYKVVYIKKDARHETPFEQYGPDKDTKYVLEVVSGFSEKYGLKVGDTIEIIK